MRTPGAMATPAHHPGYGDNSTVHTLTVQLRYKLAGGEGRGESMSIGGGRKREEVTKFS